MHPGAEQTSWDPILPMAAAAVSACIVAWLWAAVRWRQGRPLAPYKPRRPAPWKAIDLLLTAAFYLAMQGGVFALAGAVLGPGQMRLADAGDSTTEHVVGRLIADGNPWILLLCVVSAAVVAPVAEEFFFRVLLQGWLESLEHRWRRKLPTLRRLIPIGAAPIALTSLVFARMHFRVEAPGIGARLLVFLLAGDAVARLLTVACAVGLLRWRAGATAADLGWAPRKALGDIGLGLGAFAAVAAPIYAMQLGFRHLLPEHIAPDPFPLFFFALMLGILYFRTHRIVPAIVLHAAFNGTSLLLAWLGS